MPDLQIMVNTDPDADGNPLIAIYMAHPHIVEGDDDDELVPGMTVSPANARILAQLLLDTADEAEMRC